MARTRVSGRVEVGERTCGLPARVWDPTSRTFRRRPVVPGPLHRGVVDSGSLRRGAALTALLALAGCGGAQAPVAVGQRAPAFEAATQTGEAISLASLRGRPVVLYFYPRDATPGCTAEACAFRDAWDRLQARGAIVLGVSTDDIESHRAFAEEHALPFALLADTDEAIARAYGVPVRLGYAKRMTFLIDAQGILRRVFEDVDPAVHVDEVLAALAEL
ncbi:MAG: peroxiredoxin [Myxococcales bacterium]|nr:peroxiredoxin [Myxococcales bacterium]